MISLALSKDLLALYPDVHVGYFSAAGRPAQRYMDAVALRLGQEALRSLQDRRFDLDRLAEATPFSGWRQAFAKGGLQPSKYRSSIEALVRRYLRSAQPVITGHSLVDIYNAVSVKHLVPMGAYDHRQLKNKTVELRLLRAGLDRFSPVGGEPGQFPLKNGVPVYACGDDVICYGINHRDSKLTACSETSDSILFVAEAVEGKMVADFHRALGELRAVLSELKMETSGISVAKA